MDLVLTPNIVMATAVHAARPWWTARDGNDDDHEAQSVLAHVHGGWTVELSQI